MGDSDYEYITEDEEENDVVSKAGNFVAEWSEKCRRKNINRIYIRNDVTPEKCLAALKTLKEMNQDLQDQYIAASRALEEKKKKILVALGQSCASTDTELAATLEKMRIERENLLLSVAQKYIARKEENEI